MCRHTNHFSSYKRKKIYYCTNININTVARLDIDVQRCYKAKLIVINAYLKNSEV